MTHELGLALELLAGRDAVLPRTLRHTRLFGPSTLRVTDDVAGLKDVAGRALASLRPSRPAEATPACGWTGIEG